MPRGSIPGERRGGRKKGTPNKVTAEAREVFRLVFERLAPECEKWIRETARGMTIEKVTKEGDLTSVNIPGDPGKAADLLLRLAEFHIPKLGRTELAADGDGSGLVVQVIKLPAGGERG